MQNKWEHVSERHLDIVMDHLHTLNDLTPKIRCQGKKGVDPNLIFGLETKLFSDEAALPSTVQDVQTHNDEVETVTIYRGGSPPAHNHQHKDGTGCCQATPPEEAEGKNIAEETGIQREVLIEALNGKLSKESVWRVKGFVKLSDGEVYILNWAFGRFELTLTKEKERRIIRFTAMGERGELKRSLKKFVQALGAEIDGVHSH